MSASSDSTPLASNTTEHTVLHDILNMFSKNNSLFNGDNDELILHQSFENVLNFWRASTPLDEQLRQCKLVQPMLADRALVYSYMDSNKNTKEIENSVFEWSRKNSDLPLGIEVLFIRSVSSTNPEQAFAIFKAVSNMLENASPSFVKKVAVSFPGCIAQMFESLLYLPYDMEREQFIKDKTFSVYPKELVKPTQSFVANTPAYFWDTPKYNGINAIRIAVQTKNAKDVAEALIAHLPTLFEEGSATDFRQYNMLLPSIKKMFFDDVSCIEQVLNGLSLTHITRKDILNTCVLGVDEVLKKNIKKEKREKLVPYWIEQKGVLPYIKNISNDYCAPVQYKHFNQYVSIEHKMSLDAYLDQIVFATELFGAKETDKALEKTFQSVLVPLHFMTDLANLKPVKRKEFEVKISQSVLSEKTKGLLMCCLSVIGLDCGIPEKTLLFSNKNTVDTHLDSIDKTRLEALSERIALVTQKMKLLNTIAPQMKNAVATKSRKI